MCDLQDRCRAKVFRVFNGTLVNADGYHRLCAVYKFDEDAIIPCKIV